MSTHEIYEKVLQIYLERREENPDFTFAPRMIKDKRLKAGYWFQGTDDYLFSPPFSAGDSNNKTKTIGFVLKLQDGEVVGHYIEVVFGSPDNLKKIDFYKQILRICGIEYKEGKFLYGRTLEGEWEDDLRRFLSNEVIEMRSLIEDNELADEFLLPEQRFQKYYQNILEVKSNGIVSLEEQTINESVKEEADEQSKISVSSREPQNIILYGPPGTGKTYNTKQRAVELVMETSLADVTREEISNLFDEYVENNQIVFSTFHQSLSYEDFIEGIKPVMDDDSSDISYTIEDGVFKALSLKAKENFRKSNLDDSAVEQDVYLNNLIQGFKLFIEDIVLENPIQLTQATKIIDVEENCLRYRGDSSQQNRKGAKIEFSDLKYLFVNDVQSRSDVTKLKGKKGRTTYLYKAYLLLKDFERNNFKTEAFNGTSSAEEQNQYVIIIDEINRGNVSSIFGELITLIETNKRVGQPEALEVILPYSKEVFGVPSNLHIIGTMNTADRSVEALDTALRRRFTFEELMPDSSLVKNNPYLQLAKFWVDYNDIGWDDDIHITKEFELLKWLNINDEKNYHQNKKVIGEEFALDDELSSYSDSPQYSKLVTEFFMSRGWQFNPIRLDYMLETINKRLSHLLDRDHTIGHSFFMGVQSLPALKKVFSNQIIPQLKEYFYGDWNKIGMILGGAFVKKSESDVKWPKGFPDNDDFGENVSLSISSNWSADDFRSIYADIVSESADV